MRPLMIGLSMTALTACSNSANVGSASSQVAAKPADLVIRNITVIDPEHSRKVAEQDVIIQGGRIVDVVPSRGQVVAAANIVDGTGKFLMPGLMDMHAHSSIRIIHQSSLKLMTANGIMGIREMGSDCVEPGGLAMCLDEMRASQKAIEAGEMTGPRILELATAKIDSNRKDDASEQLKLYRPTNAAQAHETVAMLAQRRPDILKVSQDLHPDAFRALIEDAKERSIKVGGHIPSSLSVADASMMGMNSIEHARDLPLDCSTFGADLRRRHMAKAKGEAVEMPDRMVVPGRARDSFDLATCKAQIAAMVANKTYYVPTHLTREMDFRAGDKGYRNDPRLEFVVERQQRMWNRDLDRTAQVPPEVARDLADFFQLGLRTTKLAHDAGVKIMAGTDANDTMVFPGFSLHDELRHLVAAGLTPMEAIQTATSVPAEYLGRTADLGGVSDGKIADLLLLDADPTLDITNTSRIFAVLQGGKVMDRAALDATLAEVRGWVIMANQQAATGQ